MVDLLGDNWETPTLDDPANLFEDVEYFILQIKFNYCSNYHNFKLI